MDVKRYFRGPFVAVLVMLLVFFVVYEYASSGTPYTPADTSKVVSLIPFCSPLLMNFRISLRMPAAWEIGLSFVLMSIAIYIIIWIASRIYRVGVLMYGKRPNLPEILRWLKYS